MYEDVRARREEDDTCHSHGCGACGSATHRVQWCSGPDPRVRFPRVQKGVQKDWWAQPSNRELYKMKAGRPKVRGGKSVRMKEKKNKNKEGIDKMNRRR